jgi:drug/metabolite transporter (DMT)-like permease
LGSLELPVAILGAFVLLKESVLAIQWVGMIFILTGIILSEKKTAKMQKQNKLNSA